MNDDQAFERATSDWLEAGSDRTPPRVVDAVLLAVRSTPQERDLRIPWRTTVMPYPARIAAALAIVAVVGLAALNMLGPGPQIGSPPTPSPSTQSSVAPSQASFEPMDTSDWVGFSSVRHGYDARHPNPYNVTSADAPLTFEFLASRNGEPFLGGDLRFVAIFDDMYDTFSPGFIYPVMGAASTRLPDGMSEDDWLAVYRQADDMLARRKCIPPRDEWQPITVDGISGGLYSECFHEVLVFAGGRAYTFTITSGMGGKGDLKLLLAFVSTVTLHPDRADDST